MNGGAARRTEPRAAVAPRLGSMQEALIDGKGTITQLGAGGGRRLTFTELYGRAVARAAMLQARGVGPGDRVGIWAKNSIDWVISDLACLARGACSVPFDATLKASPEALCERYGLRALFVDSPAPDAASQILAIGAVEPPVSGDAPWHTFDSCEPYTVKLTSGTTGDSKSILATPKHFDHMAGHVVRLFELDENDRFLNFLPLSTWLQRFFVHLGLLVGFDIVLGRTQSATSALRSVRPTLVVAVPHFLKALYELHGARSDVSLAEAWGGKLRSLWTGSAPIERWLLDAYLAAGLPVHEGYGMSETGLIAKSYPGACKVGSVGKPFPDKHIEFDADGQVLVRSEFHTNTGYDGIQPAPDANVFRPGGVVATGDVGYLDADGFLFLTGRLKDAIVLANGKKVAPAALEARVSALPSIQSVCVVGSGQPFLTAVIVPAVNATRADIERELSELNATLSPHERIYAFHLHAPGFSQEAGQLTATGKLVRRQIATQFREQIAALYPTVSS